MQVAPEDAIRALQAALPSNLSKPPAPVELENVKPTLLLTPTESGGVASELAGGAFDLGDRVACLTGSGRPFQRVTLTQSASGACRDDAKPPDTVGLMARCGAPDEAHYL